LKRTIPRKRLLQLAETIQDLAAVFQDASLNPGNEEYQRGVEALARFCDKQFAECQTILASCEFQGDPEAKVVAALEALVECCQSTVSPNWRDLTTRLEEAGDRLRKAVDAVPVRPLLEALDHPDVQPTQHARVPKRPSVILGGPQDSPTVNGKKKVPLTPAKYAVAKALVEAGEAGLDTNELTRRSGKQDAVKHLRDLQKQDGDWKKAIIMAGKSWGRYRVRHV
jgi:hypothetical protein